SPGARDQKPGEQPWAASRSEGHAGRFVASPVQRFRDLEALRVGPDRGAAVGEVDLHLRGRIELAHGLGDRLDASPAGHARDLYDEFLALLLHGRLLGRSLRPTPDAFPGFAPGKGRAFSKVLLLGLLRPESRSATNEQAA